MQSNPNLEKPDKWELLLDEEIKKLQQCQNSKSFTSCFECKEILTCDIKQNYVNAVYESMNKGSGGGFEF